MRYFLATYEILDGEHEHNGALILEAETAEEAYKMALQHGSCDQT